MPGFQSACKVGTANHYVNRLQCEARAQKKKRDDDFYGEWRDSTFCTCFLSQVESSSYYRGPNFRMKLWPENGCVTIPAKSKTVR